MGKCEETQQEVIPTNYTRKDGWECKKISFDSDSHASFGEIYRVINKKENKSKCKRNIQHLVK